jgi:F0F1-type ATP synthase membrane subunit c/vacuolar-type H+-ATPase subunit K
MVPTITRFAAETAEVAVKGGWNPTAAKAFMLGIAFLGAALGLSYVGANYMKALGRNPEAGKAAGQVVIIAAMIEVTALLAFLGAIIVK